MDSLQSKLFGALVGLARATDGNEHLITADSTAVVLSCLAARPSSDEELILLLNKISEVKREMVPDCFLCVNPCGRTSAFDMAELQCEPDAIREAKDRILHALQKANEKTNELALYKGLVVLGIKDLTQDLLISIAEELETS